MREEGTVHWSKRRKICRGLLYHNITPFLALRHQLKTSKIAHLGRERRRASCSWPTGAHMTKFFADGAWVHGTDLLGVSRCSPLTDGTDVFRALGAYVFQGLALETSYDNEGSQRFRGVGDDDWVVAGSRLHNHLQLLCIAYEKTPRDFCH